MKDFYIKDFETNKQVTDFFMVKSIGIKVGSNDREYLDIHLSDNSGEVVGKKWNLAEEEKPGLSEIKEGDIVKVIAQTQDWNNNHQFIIQKIRLSNAGDRLDMSDFIKSAPEKPEDMYEFILGVSRAIADEDIRRVTDALLERNRDKLMYYPAAAKNHHAEYGGLLWHIKRMLMAGKALSEVYDFLDGDLVSAGVIVHDIEKLNEIDAGENGMATGYSKKGQLLGHIVQGVASLEKLGEELGVPEEKILMLQHMVLSHHYEPDFGSPKKPMFPEAELLHYLDIMDARMYDMEEALSGVQPGGFSERVRTLDNRRIYRPEFLAPIK